MRTDCSSERGETLLEIVVAIVIIGLVVGGFFAAYATASTATKSHRDLVTADVVLRSYAEATKKSVRQQCTPSTASYSVAYSPPAPAATWTLSPVVGSPQPCPPSVTTTQQVNLVVTLPNGTTKQLNIFVRAP